MKKNKIISEIPLHRTIALALLDVMAVIVSSFAEPVNIVFAFTCAGQLLFSLLAFSVRLRELYPFRLPYPEYD